jgi:hypothetical protein
MKRCPQKLITEIANVRRQAHDVGGVPTLFAKTAENAARNGQCAVARRELARTKRIIRRYWRAG